MKNKHFLLLCVLNNVMLNSMNSSPEKPPQRLHKIARQYPLQLPLRQKKIEADKKTEQIIDSSDNGQAYMQILEQWNKGTRAKKLEKK